MCEENKLNGYEIIQGSLSSPMSIQELALKLVPGAIEIGRSRIGTKSNPECKTEYNEVSLEIFVWALGLMCQEWILENLNRKSNDGHCWTHKQQNQKPCSMGADFHKNLYEECKKTFREVLGNA
jgi:hypothetical protein